MDVLPVLLVLTKIFLAIVSLLFFVSGLDDFFIDVYFAARSLSRRLQPRGPTDEVTDDALLRAPEQLLAVMVPAWDESAVIGRMVDNILRTARYSNYHVFVGTYPNDPATQREVEIVREQFPNVHRVVCPHNGPTNKADCLNWIYQGIWSFEKTAGMSFAMFVMHDAEDVPHPLSFKLLNATMPPNDMVQFPVLCFEPPWHQFTCGHYLDEFAQHHLKDLVVRQWLTGSIPAAGVACGFSRRALDLLACDSGNLIFNLDSLTEDYEIGLRLHRYGLKQAFVRRPAPPAGGGGDTGHVKWSSGVARQYIGTSEYFPSALSTAVRQKSRWIIGIALQGWVNLRWRGNCWMKYMLYRDRKVLVTNVVVMFGYLMVVFVASVWVASYVSEAGYRYPPLVERGSWLWYVILANAFFMVERVMQRAFYVYHLYGPRQAVLSIPRQIWGNVVNFLATRRAVIRYVHHLVYRTPLTWDKTAHVFPSEAELGRRRRTLGDRLLERRLVTVAQLEQALRRQQDDPSPLGAILLDMGFLTDDDLMRVLADSSIPWREIDPQDVEPAVLAQVPPGVAARYSVLPVGVTDGRLLRLATDLPPTPARRQELETVLGRAVELVSACRSDIAFAIRQAYHSHSDTSTRDQHLRAVLLDRHLVTPDGLTAALRTQRRSYRRLGDLLATDGVLTRKDLDATLVQYHAEGGKTRLGQLVVERRLATAEQVEDALRRQESEFLPLRGALVQVGAISEDTLAQAVAARASRSAVAGPIRAAVFLLVGLTVLAATTRARAAHDASVDHPGYIEQLRGPNHETWWQRELRRIRTFPHVDRADRLVAAGRLREAAAELQAAVAADPDDLVNRFRYLVVLNRMQEHSPAVAEATMILTARPRFVPALLYRGLARQALGDVHGSLADFRAALTVQDIEPRDRSFALAMVADLALALGRYDEARAAAEQLVRGTPRPEHYRRLAHALGGLSRLTEAEAALRAALGGTSDGPGQSAKDGQRTERISLYLELADLAQRRRAHDEAQQWLIAADKLRPANPDILRRLGTVAQDPRESAAWFRRAAAVTSSADDRERLAYALEAAGDHQEAARQFALVASETRPGEDRHRILVALGYAYIKLGRFGDAAHAFREATKIKADAPTLSALADALERHGRTPEAVDVLRRLIVKAPSAETDLQLARLYAKLGDDRQALLHLERAMRSAGNERTRAEAHKERGFLHYRLGRYAEARQAFEQAIAINDRDVPVYLALGETCMKLNAYEDAVDYLKRALVLEERSAR